MAELPHLDEVDVAGKKVFCRLDLNVPMQGRTVVSDARLQAALPTLRHLLRAGARLTVASHLGRPKQFGQPEFSLEPVGMRLSELLGQELVMASDCIGDGVRGLLRELRPGHLLLLDNLRYHRGEEGNDPEFARALAQGQEVYINDAFGASHRAHASIVGMVRHVPVAAAGYLLAREAEALGSLLQAPKKPFVAVVGGAKVADKVGVLEALLRRVDTLCIGGAMAYTFMQAQQISIGASRFEEDKLHVVRAVLSRARAHGVQVLLPQDHVAADRFAADARAVRVGENNIPAGLMGLDIGPKTAAAMASAIAGAATVFWNGPMGVCEWPPFAAGTRTVAQAVADCRGHTVVGGGDSVAALEQAGLVDQIDHVSTGGGASLELLQHGTLPGIAILQDLARQRQRDAQRAAARGGPPDDPLP